MSILSRMYPRRVKSKKHLPKSLGPQHSSVYDEDAWRVFRIMSEFVDGFEVMSEIGPAVTIFGSARKKAGDRYYELSRKVAAKLAKAGYTIITGGGPGIMEAANRGAIDAKGRSVGLNIVLPQEQCINAYVNVPVGFRYFFVRKVMFIKYASAAIIMPGGLGTMDEFFEVMTLIQTDKIRPFPVILVGSDYWKGLLAWMESSMMKEAMIDKIDLSICKVIDDPDQIVREIKKQRRAKKPKVNF